MSDGVAIVGAGIHRFGRHDGVSGRQQAVHAVRAALSDAGIGWGDVQFAVGGSMAAGAADTLVEDLGLTGLQFINVHNGCATGGSALIAAVHALGSGAFDLGVVVGFDKHPRGAFAIDVGRYGLPAWYSATGLALTTQFFALKLRRYLHEHDLPERVLAAVAAKSFRNGSMNPMAWRRRAIGEAEVAESMMVSDPLRRLMFCSPAEGAVALVVCRGGQARRYSGRPVFVRAATLRSRRFGSFEVLSPSLALQRADSPTADAARAAFEQAGTEPGEVSLAQLQDTDSGAEIMHMAETGLCEHGEQASLVLSGETGIGGRLPVNTDGGCLANGEPIGASGLRQVYENVIQLRGLAGARQVPGSPMVALSHVYGAPGISACTVLTT
jgi:acetyl-CoA acetyltransferase